MNTEIQNLLATLTLEQKANLSSGADFWTLPGIAELDLPSIMVTDGPHGLRKQAGGSDHIGLQDSVPATCFPTASGMAASWNLSLVREVGVALGREARRENVSVLLGPGLNIKRNPLGGRNFEYFSEDPLLSGALSVAWINGVQSQGVGTSAKHYAVNNHEAGRMVVDAIVDQRTLREIYLSGFEAVVKQAQPWTIMCAYNKLNGSYLSENITLLNHILREQWHYQGLVMTDWGATHNRVAGIKAGLNLEMPSSGMLNTQKIIDAVNIGALSLEELDTSVAKVLELILKSRDKSEPASDFSFEHHHGLAKRAAAEACVLLHNDSDFLPLNPAETIAVIGALAADTRYQGSGSSQIIPTQLEQPLECITDLVSKRGGQVHYAQGYSLSGQASEADRAQALVLAQKADKVVVFVGLTPEYESEGFDRSHLNLPAAQLQLLAALLPVHHKIVVVLQNGAPVTLRDIDAVPSILEAYLGGQAGASALADILFGELNPSGKLAETFPCDISDSPNYNWFPGETRQSQYRESIWVGYRYFNTTGQKVAFPFGHGLSYTQFSYSQLRVGEGSSGELSLDENTELAVRLRVKNEGTRAGGEIVQLYVGQANSSVHRPSKELKAFDKVFLEPGQEAEICLTLNHRSFAFWHCDSDTWRVESDQYTVSIGASIEDIRLEQSLSITTAHALGARDTALATYYAPQHRNFDEVSFVTLLGHAIPTAIPTRPYQMNSTLFEVQDSWIGRLLLKQVKKTIDAMVGESSDKDRIVIEAIASEMPLRVMVANSQGKLSEKTMSRLIHAMNRHWLKCLRGSAADSH